MDFSSLTGPVFDNTLAALIGAFIISAATWGYRRTIDSINERKYSISGQYRAYYEEIADDGSITYEKADVILRQKGLKIFADDFDEATGKDWGLEGEIDPVTGRVYGYYKIKSKGDTGLGVCIFEQKKNGTLDGLWAGYDTTIEKIEHGRYTLIKRLPVTIRSGVPSDATTVLNMIDTELGEDWGHDDIDKAIVDNFLFVAEIEKKIVGFSMLRMLATGEMEKEFKGHPYKVPRDIQHADKHAQIGFIEAIATDPDYQKRGIGTKLIERSLERLEQAGAELITTMAWKTTNVHLGPTLDAFDFSMRHEFKDFWYKKSIDDKEHCEICGNPCRCGSVLYTLSLNTHGKKRRAA